MSEHTMNAGSEHSSHAAHEPLQMTDVTEPTDTDVLCGRGGAALRHPGNQTYRRLVNLNKGLYITCLKTEKLKISRSIVAAIREQRGRFLEKQKDGQKWYDIGDKKAVEKTSQALREGQPKLRQKIVEMGGGAAAAGQLMEAQFGAQQAAAAMYQRPESVGLTTSASALDPAAAAAAALTQQQQQQQLQHSNHRRHSHDAAVAMAAAVRRQELQQQQQQQQQDTQQLQADLLQRLSLCDPVAVAAAVEDQRAASTAAAILQHQQRAAAAAAAVRLRPSSSLHRGSAAYEREQLGISAESQLSLMSDFSAFGSSSVGSSSIPTNESLRSGGGSIPNDSLRSGGSIPNESLRSGTSIPNESLRSGGRMLNESLRSGGRMSNESLRAAAAAAMPNESLMSMDTSFRRTLESLANGSPFSVDQQQQPYLDSNNNHSAHTHNSSNGHNGSSSINGVGTNNYPHHHHHHAEASTTTHHMAHHAATATAASAGTGMAPCNNNNNSSAGGGRDKWAGMDRRRVFAKMKYNRPPSVKGVVSQQMSQRSLGDGMPDIHMVESSLSLYSNLSNMTGVESSQRPFSGMESSSSSKPVVETVKLVDHSNSFFASSNKNASAGFPEILGSGSRHSIMSGLSRISDSSPDQNSIFSDLSKKIGNVSTRSIAMSEISAIDMQERDNEDDSSSTFDHAAAALEGETKSELDFDL